MIEVKIKKRGIIKQPCPEDIWEEIYYGNKKYVLIIGYTWSDVEFKVGGKIQFYATGEDGKPLGKSVTKVITKVYTGQGLQEHACLIDFE